MQPPVASRRPHRHELHGDIRPDDYYWLRDRQDPEVIAYLEAENRYTESVLAPLQPRVDALYHELLERVDEDRIDVPVQDGPYFYYWRMVPGQQYRVYARKRARSRAALDEAPEEVILNVNQLAEGHAFESVTVLRTSPDHRYLAYLENHDGTDRYLLQVKDLERGVLLQEAIPNVFLYGSVEWDGSGRYLFYTQVDESQRPWQCWRHELGSDGPDTLIYQEDDVTFSLVLSRSMSGRHLFLHSQNKESDEIRWIPAATPLAEWQVFAPRVPGIRYDLEDWGPDFIIRTNEEAENFRLMATPLDNTRRESWRELWTYQPSVFIEGVTPFASGLLIEGREDGLSQLWVFRDGRAERLEWSEPIYTVAQEANRDYHVARVLIAFQSLTTPRTVFELDLGSLARQDIHQDRVPGSYNQADYVQERVWAEARDGVRVPVSLLYRQGALERGPAPLFLYGYGSYGASMDPRFDPFRLPLLDRGIVYAVAHIRGGAEMGQGWYQQGKLLRKTNTFNDFVDTARYLIAEGYTAPDRLAIEGRSAGGLLMGAVVNQSPELFRVVLAGVPFVDVVTTMLDASIPLTSLEWDEWGNPADPEFYHYMKGYSPYDNVARKAYPHLFVSTGLNDPRVAYWEPAKWVARLRITKTDDNVLLLRTHMGAGHGGSSGRYERLRERAQELAFVLDRLGIPDGEARRA
jgi:oligopeptidase B